MRIGMWGFARPSSSACIRCLAGVCSFFVSVLLFAGEKPPPKVALHSPAIGYVFPVSVQVGRAVDVDLKGNYLDRAQGIRCECDDLTAKLTASTPLGLKATITAEPGAKPGPRFLRVETPRGLSNRLLFRVTGWPSLVEQESNDGYEEAESVPVPSLIEGKIATVHDSDMFRFHVKAGERLAFNVLSGRSRIKGHVVAILMTADGRELARNLSYFGTDPYLDYTFDEEGDYILTIVPRRFSDFYTILSDDTKINWQYELAIGRSPILWSLYPMGGRRGTTVDVELRADFLDPQSVPEFSGKGVSASLAPVDDPCQCRFRLSVAIAEDAELGARYLTFPDPSGALMPLAFAVNDLPELTEQEPNDGLTEGRRVTVPVIVNGRIDRPGDRDGVLFKVDQYDELAFHVDAKGLGSHVTDPNLTMARLDGELKGIADDRCKKCGPFFNAVRKKEKLDPQFWHYFQEGNPNDAAAAGDYLLQLRDNAKRGGPNHTYRLVLRNKKSDFRVGVVSAAVRGSLGGEAEIPVVIRAEEGFKETVEIQVKNLPPGLKAEPLMLPADGQPKKLVIRHDPAVLPPDEITGRVEAWVQLVGTAKVGDEQVSRRAELPAFFTEDGAGYNEIPRGEVLVSFVEPALFSLSVEQPFRGFRMDLTKGGKIEFPVTIVRDAEFNEALAWHGVQLPAGLRIEAGPEIDGVVAMTLLADPAVIAPGKHKLALRASAESSGRALTEVTRGFTVQVK